MRKTNFSASSLPRKPSEDHPTTWMSIHVCGLHPRLLQGWGGDHAGHYGGARLAPEERWPLVQRGVPLLPQEGQGGEND